MVEEVKMTVQARSSGPNAPGGFTTVSGTAHGMVVHWIGDDARAADLERAMATTSRLNQLLLRNAYSIEGLNPFEKSEAINLIESTTKSLEICHCGATGVGDTGMCQAHALFALRTRN